MALLEIPLALGIRQGTRAEHLDATQGYLNLENLRARASGAGYKRFGFGVGSTTRIDGTSRSAGQRMHSDRLVPNVIDGSTVDTQSSAAGVSTSRGRLPEALFGLIDMPSLSTTGTIEDVEYCNGYFAVTSTMQQGGSYYSAVTIVDAATGAIVHGPYLLGAFTRPIVCSYSTYFLVLKCDEASTTLSVMYLNTSSYTTINSGWSAAGGNVTTAWSTFHTVAACSMSDRIAIVFGLDAGTDRVGVKTWNISGQVESTTINTASTTPNGGVDVAIGPNADTLWVTWNQGAAIKVCGLTPTNLAVVLATSATIITASAALGVPFIVASSTTSGKGRLLVNDTISGLYCCQIRGFQTSAGAAATDGSQKLIPGLQNLSRPFAKGGRYYVSATAGMATLSQSTQSVACIVDWSEDVTWVRPVCNIEPGLASLSTWGRTKAVTGSDSNKRYTTQNIQRSNVGTACALVEIDFASTNRWQAVAFGNSTYLSGGVLGYVDGQRFNEAGFLHRPPKPTSSTSGTGLTLTLGRKYVAVYEAIDSDGNLTISGVSDPSASTGAVTNKTITVTSQPCAMTYRLDSNGLALATSRVVLYATADNGGVPPYYRHSVKDNDTSSNIVTFSDTTTDATLTANAKLYEEPGINGSAQDRRAPPGFQHLTTYGGLLVGASGSSVWYSGQPVIGETAWFSPIFQVPIEGEGDITGLAAQDGTLFVFKRRAIYALSGEWPSDNASSGGLGTPRRLAVDTGCIEQRSVCVTSRGTFFQSDRGIEILTRAQAVEWVGYDVQDELEARPYVNAATYDPNDNVVIFEVSSARSSGVVSGTGRGLVFQLDLGEHGGWISKDRRYDQAGTADSPAQSACMLWSTTANAWRYAWLDTSGYVYTEDRTTYLDPGARWVTMRAETGWVKARLQGMQFAAKALLLAKRTTDHDLGFALAYDYSASYETTTTFTRATIATVTGALKGGNMQLQHDSHNDAEGEAVRAKIEDATPTGGTVGTGQGATWIGITFDITPMEETYRLPGDAR